ncbi:MAG: NUDIX hydrolase [Acidimicrobiales bacterium]
MVPLEPADLTPRPAWPEPARVAGAPAGDAVVEAFRARMLTFVDAHPDALLRTCARGHLTSSALVVHADRRRVLLLEHRKLRRWFQPGGHADGEANLAASARREATEESGIAGLTVLWPAIDLDIHEVRPPAEPAHDHLDVRYLVLAPPDAVAAHNHESTGQAWVTEGGLDGFGADDGLRRLVRRGLAMAAALP